MLIQRRHALVARTEAAVAVALSVLLGNIRLIELPNGGSIALATLPLLALALSRGMRAGVLAGACAGLAHALAGGTIVHPAQLALDYLVAYAALGLAGVALLGARRPSRLRVSVAIVAAMTVHLAAMVLSGIIFFAPTAGAAALVYSLAYNAATVVPETLLALWITPTLARAIARATPADAWRRGLLDPPRLQPRATRTILAETSIDMPQPRAVSVSERPPATVLLVRQAPFSGRPPLARVGGSLQR